MRCRVAYLEGSGVDIRHLGLPTGLMEGLITGFGLSGVEVRQSMLGNILATIGTYYE
jgi:hypothetical protein